MKPLSTNALSHHNTTPPHHASPHAKLTSDSHGKVTLKLTASACKSTVTCLGVCRGEVPFYSTACRRTLADNDDFACFPTIQGSAELRSSMRTSCCSRRLSQHADCMHAGTPPWLQLLHIVSPSCIQVCPELWLCYIAYWCATHDAIACTGN